MILTITPTFDNSEKAHKKRQCTAQHIMMGSVLADVMYTGKEPRMLHRAKLRQCGIEDVYVHEEENA